MLDGFKIFFDVLKFVLSLIAFILGCGGIVMVPWFLLYQKVISLIPNPSINSLLTVVFIASLSFLLVQFCRWYVRKVFGLDDKANKLTKEAMEEMGIRVPEKNK